MCNDDMCLLLARSLLKLSLQLGCFFKEVTIYIFPLSGSTGQLILSGLHCITSHGEQSSVEFDLAVPGAVRSRPSPP